jgi:Restriction Endonuclease associating with ARP
MDYSQTLRQQLRSRAEALLTKDPTSGYRSLGASPTVLFHEVDGHHANFYRPAWQAIQMHPGWKARLDKSHSKPKALPPEWQDSAGELDSSNSSDALLMNCFCAPGASIIGARLLGAAPAAAVPEFGWKAEVSLSGGSVDKTEIDMRLGDTLVEAKLTEKSFTERGKPHVSRYTAIPRVFDIDLLPSNADEFFGYQLIRNVLAADQHGLRLMVLIDSRRPDLLHEWWGIHAAIRDGALRARCAVTFWQELARALPNEHAAFLEQKYGL